MSAGADDLHVLAAPDKFKGTATAAEVAAAMIRAAQAHGLHADAVPMSDGGDGLLAVFGGANRTSAVTAPDGSPIEAGWRLDGTLAVIESALASGLTLAGGPERNDPVRATSRGTGELIEYAVRSGARRILLGLGGSASTDGGLPLIEALSDGTRDAIASGSVALEVCCDVDTRFTDAAQVFGPQKGATPDQVSALRAGLEAARRRLVDAFGIDVQAVPGSGAAGGMGGALAAVGGHLRRGFDLVAQETRLAAHVESADLVLTGEGRVDGGSFEGKVVGGVLALAGRHGVDAGVVAGAVAGAADVTVPVPLVSLVDRYGRERAMGDVLGCVEQASGELVSRWLSRRRPG